jgi:hypothetical protein
MTTFEKDEDSKALIKNALLGFNQQWESYRQRDDYPGDSEIDKMLESYEKLYMDISVKLRDLLPDKLTTELQNLAFMMRSKIHTMKSIEYDPLESAGECANKAFEIYNNFDDYFE